eukprot:364457-Rhodomonas_salina.1
MFWIAVIAKQPQVTASHRQGCSGRHVSPHVKQEFALLIMNAWTSEEDAWWWCLWTPGCMDQSKTAGQTEVDNDVGEPVSETAAWRDRADAAGRKTSGHLDQWIAVKAAVELDPEHAGDAYDRHSGWGVRTPIPPKSLECEREGHGGHLMWFWSLTSSSSCRRTKELCALLSTPRVRFWKNCSSWRM